MLDVMPVLRLTLDEQTVGVVIDVVLVTDAAVDAGKARDCPASRASVA